MGNRQKAPDPLYARGAFFVLSGAPRQWERKTAKLAGLPLVFAEGIEDCLHEATQKFRQLDGVELHANPSFSRKLPSAALTACSRPRQFRIDWSLLLLKYDTLCIFATSP
jgi:hypothetical protein